MAADMHRDESLTRFVLNRKHIRKDCVKPSAFMPPYNALTMRHELSVFRILGLTDPDIWALGDRYVVSPERPIIHGRGDVAVSKVVRLGLSVEPDDSPPLHASIIGWPDRPEEKSARKSLAQELAAAAEPHLRG